MAPPKKKQAAPPKKKPATTTPGVARAPVSKAPAKRKAVGPPNETILTPPNRPKFSPSDYIGCRVLVVEDDTREVGSVIHYEKESFLIVFDSGHTCPMDMEEVCRGIGRYESDYTGPTWSRNHNPKECPATGELTEQVPHFSKVYMRSDCLRINYTGPTAEEGGNPPFFVGKRVKWRFDSGLEEGYIDACYKRVGGGYGPDTLWHLNLPSSGKDPKVPGHIMIKDHTRYFK